MYSNLSLNTVLARHELVLDKPRTLTFTIAAMAEYNRLSGRPGVEVENLDDAALFLVELCRHSDPDVTVEQIKPHVNMLNLIQIGSALRELFAAGQRNVETNYSK